MIRLICKRLQQTGTQASTSSHAYSFSTSNSTPQHSLTLSYLLNSCGLSSELAISASKKLHIETTDKPDSVLNLLKTHGLTQTHIKNLVTNRPVILQADPYNTLKPNIELFGSLGFSGTNLAKILSKDPRILETDAYTVVEFFRTHSFSEKQITTLTLKRPTLYLYNAHKIFKPKWEFFKSLGFSVPEIAQILSTEPYILERSLENQIIPSVQVLKRIVGTDENVLKAIKACYRILELNLEKVLEPNISTLINHGVPESKALKLLMLQPKSLLLRDYRFSEVVGEVMKLGFDPTNLLFILAIRSMAVMSKSLWEQKLEAFRSFGLSEEEIISAFKVQPMCMIASVKKIRKLMGFYVNELNLNPSKISKNPNLILLSLEKRIIPRCSVLQLLMSKDLIKGDISLPHVFRMTEKLFVEKFLSKYQHLIPEVVKAHQGEIQFQGFQISPKT